MSKPKSYAFQTPPRIRENMPCTVQGVPARFAGKPMTLTTTSSSHIVVESCLAQFSVSDLQELRDLFQGEIKRRLLKKK